MKHRSKVSFRSARWRVVCLCSGGFRRVNRGPMNGLSKCRSRLWGPGCRSLSQKTIKVTGHFRGRTLYSRPARFDVDQGLFSHQGPTHGCHAIVRWLVLTFCINGSNADRSRYSKTLPLGYGQNSVRTPEDERPHKLWRRNRIQKTHRRIAYTWTHRTMSTYH